MKHGKQKGKKASSYAEDTRDLLKLALEEKPNAFREVFDEIMLSKIVDISDEMKDEIAQSMFGESSHEYGKKKKKHDKNEMKEAKKEEDEEDEEEEDEEEETPKKKKMKESFEPDEDEDEDDVGDEDEDFDISDEDLEDLDLDDLDFEEDEEISEGEMEKQGTKLGGEQTNKGQRKEKLTPQELAKLQAEMKARANLPAAARKKAVDTFVNGTENVKKQIAAMMKARLEDEK